MQTAKDALQAGDKLKARNLLVSVIQSEPTNAQAWYMLSFAVEADQALYCIGQASKRAPQNKQVQERFEALHKQAQPLQPFPIPGYQAPVGAQVHSYSQVPQKGNTSVSIPFYRDPLFKVFSFLILLPVWVLIILTDPNEKTYIKIIAVIIQVIACTFGAIVGLQTYMNLVR
jgi:hypothetical protein